MFLNFYYSSSWCQSSELLNWATCILIELSMKLNLPLLVTYQSALELKTLLKIINNNPKLCLFGLFNLNIKLLLQIVQLITKLFKSMDFVRSYFDTNEPLTS